MTDWVFGIFFSSSSKEIHIRIVWSKALKQLHWQALRGPLALGSEGEGPTAKSKFSKIRKVYQPCSQFSTLNYWLTHTWLQCVHFVHESSKFRVRMMHLYFISKAFHSIKFCILHHHHYIFFSHIFSAWWPIRTVRDQKNSHEVISALLRSTRIQTQNLQLDENPAVRQG